MLLDSRFMAQSVIHLQQNGRPKYSKCNQQANVAAETCPDSS